MTSEAQKRAVKKYCDSNIRQITLKLNITKDADIIEAFENASSNVEFIRQLFRKHENEEVKDG